MKDQRGNTGQEKMKLWLTSNALKTDRETLTGRHCVQQTIIYDKVTFAISRYSATMSFRGDFGYHRIHPLHFTVFTNEAQERRMEEKGRN